MLTTKNNLAFAYRAAGDLDSAISLAREAAIGLEKRGAALFGEGKYADAEPLLIDGYNGMKEREATIPEIARGRIDQALDRIVRFYEVCEKPDDMLKW